MERILNDELIKGIQKRLAALNFQKDNLYCYENLRNYLDGIEASLNVKIDYTFNYTYIRLNISRKNIDACVSEFVVDCFCYKDVKSFFEDVESSYSGTITETKVISV